MRKFAIVERTPKYNLPIFCVELTEEEISYMIERMNWEDSPRVLSKIRSKLESVLKEVE